MNLTVERAVALPAIQRVIGVVERKHTIPILSNLVLTAEGSRLSIRGTDLEMEMVEAISAEVMEPGAVTIPADKLLDIVRNADAGAQIAIKVDAAGFRAEVKSGRSRFQVPTLPASDYPEFPAEGFGEGFSMPAKLLADMLARVVTGVEDQKRITALTCVYLCNTDDQLHAVAGASTGIRLRREPRPDGANVKAIMPVKLVRQLTGWLTDADGDVRVSSITNNPGLRPADLIRFEHGETVFTSKLFDAPAYVDYLVPLIEEHEVSATTDQDGLSAAVRRALVMQDVKSKAVRLSFADGGLKVQARNDQAGEGEDEIAAEYDGPAHSFLLNSDKLTDIISALRGDAVEMAFALSYDAKNPDTSKVIIRAPADQAFTAILMQPRA